MVIVYHDSGGRKQGISSLQIKKSERPVDALAVKTSITDSLTDNFKSRDVSASKNQEMLAHLKRIIFFFSCM